MRVFDAKPHLYCNNVSVEPWEQGPSADVVQPRRRTRRSCVFVFLNFLVSVVTVDFALLLPLSFLLSLLSALLGYLLSYNCCIDINLWSLLFQTTPFVKSLIYQSSPITKPHPPPVFIAPPHLYYIEKTGFLYLKRQYLRIFHRFLPVVQSNINRFSNSFHSRIALSKLYNIAAQSFVAKQTSLHQNNYRNFFTGHSVSVR